MEYHHIVQTEHTKRKEIESWEKMTLEQIKARRDFLIEYLEKSFDERAKVFCGFFTIVDQAIANSNNEQLAFALDSITELAKSSPFKDLVNLNAVQSALADPNHEWHF